MSMELNKALDKIESLEAQARLDAYLIMDLRNLVRDCIYTLKSGVSNHGTISALIKRAEDIGAKL